MILTPMLTEPDPVNSSEGSIDIWMTGDWGSDQVNFLISLGIDVKHPLYLGLY